MYRNELKGNKNYFELAGDIELSRVRVTEGKITVNVRGKTTLVRVSARFEFLLKDFLKVSS